MFQDGLESSPVLPYELENLTSTIESWSNQTENEATDQSSLFSSDSGLVAHQGNTNDGNEKPPFNQGQSEELQSAIGNENKKLTDVAPTRKSARIGHPSYLAKVAQRKKAKMIDELKPKQGRSRNSKVRQKDQYSKKLGRKSSQLGNSEHLSQHQIPPKHYQMDTEDQSNNDVGSSGGWSMIPSGNENRGENEPCLDFNMFCQSTSFIKSASPTQQSCSSFWNPSESLSFQPIPSPSSSTVLPGFEHTPFDTSNNTGPFIGDLQYVQDTVQYLGDPYMLEMLAGVEPNQHIYPYTLPLPSPNPVKIESSASKQDLPASLIGMGFQSTEWYEYPLNLPSKKDTPGSDAAATDDITEEEDTCSSFESGFKDGPILFGGGLNPCPDAEWEINGNYLHEYDE
ncbi:unnamed protein product [Orchesella dallaii]|uniref:Uncharacterized protein n=1 Tax=Orchesella dallaii TaxID=48710 RepID=A0ABP1QJ78_9HEXA